MSLSRQAVLWLSIFFGISGLSSASEIDVTAPAAEIGHGLVQGYLHDQKPINSVVFVPVPPEKDSKWQAADDAISQDTMKLRGSARWDLAAQDAILTFPEAAAIFQCSLGMKITEERTPALYRLLQRSLTDFGLATYPAGTVLEEALNIARTICSKGPVAVRLAKQSCANGERFDPAIGFQEEADMFGKCFETADQKEGMSAFLEKRSADFKGI